MHMSGSCRQQMGASPRLLSSQFLSNLKGTEAYAHQVMAGHCSHVHSPSSCMFFPPDVNFTHPHIHFFMQLERRGVPIPEDGGTISDPQLLMEVMEQREQIEETDDPVVLQTMLQENKLLQQATTEVRSTAPHALDHTGNSLLMA